MNKFQSSNFKLQIIIIILAILSLPLMFVSAGVVPCGLAKDDPDQAGDQTVPCTLCHFFVLFKNIIDFVIFPVVPILAALMLTIGGFMYVFAYFNPGEVLPGGEGGPALLSQAKKVITSVVWGLIIIFASWLIINTFFQIIGVADWTGLKGGWWKINCPT